MSEISRVSIVDPTAWSEAFYFQSLLHEGVRAGLLVQPNIDAIHTECVRFLAYKTERYTGGDSSSVKVELAENILQSILYTIGFTLKSMAPEDAISALKQKTIKSLYEKGRRKIGTKLRAARHLHDMVLRSLVQTENETYNATIVEGIKGFFKIYDADYAAHEIRITADYPLSNQIIDFAGVEFIIGYLKSVLWENAFCSKFDTKRIHALMYGYHKEYTGLVINIYDQVLTSAIGCVLAGLPPAELLLPENKVIALQSLWLFKSKQEIEGKVFKAGSRLVDILQIQDQSLRKYMNLSLSHVSKAVYLAMQSLTLDKVFICR